VGRCWRACVEEVKPTGQTAGAIRVLDSRGVNRRRECLKCFMRFSTEEVVVTKPVKSVEKKKRQTKKRVKNILPTNNWQQLAKNISARRTKLEETARHHKRR
jgi:transcriptional regulator NrdR family protein